MQTINKDELFGHVCQFLKAKGIELQEGAYTHTIKKGCQVLADTINLSQQAMNRAKAELDRTLNHAREVIHRKTAPRKPPVQPQAQPPPPPASDSLGSEQQQPPGAKRRRASTKSGSTRKPRRKKAAV
jgi:hypothetical protein